MQHALLFGPLFSLRLHTIYPHLAALLVRSRKATISVDIPHAEARDLVETEVSQFECPADFQTLLGPKHRKESSL